MSSVSSASIKRSFAQAVEQHCLKKNIGENGMLQYSNRGVGSDLLVLNQLVRGGNPEAEVKVILTRGDPDEIADLCILLFVTRNARGGKGEKKLSYDILVLLWEQFPETAARLIPLFAHYGYWKDLFLLLKMSPSNEAMRSVILNAVAQQLQADISALNMYKADKESVKQPSVSLLAKWLPREGSSLDRKTKFVNHFVGVMWSDEGLSTKNDMVVDGEWKSGAKKKYRQVVAELASYLALPEVLLSAHREDEINFSRLASKATMRLRKVLMNEGKHPGLRSQDPKRIRLGERFLEHVVSKKGLNGKQLMPHEIVSRILKGGSISNFEELVLDAQWKDLWKGVEAQIKAKVADDGGTAAGFNPTRMIPMADVSGSMHGVPMEVSIALSIGLSEITHPAFRHLVLTFDSHPMFHKLNAEDSIVRKVRSLARAPWGMSTNFEAAYDLILDLVLRNKLAREDMPALVVFSDMQFNQAANRCSGLDVMHDAIKAKVRRVARQLGWADAEPTPMVYWNLRNTHGHPVDKNTEGAVLLAGFSPSLLRMVMGGGALEETEVEAVQADGTVRMEKVRVTPEQILRKTLDDSLYDPVRVVLATSGEGCLKQYKPPEPVQDEDGFDVV